MKQMPILFFLLISCTLYSQNNYQLTWGNGIRLKRGTADLGIIAADNSGLYFTEERKLYTNADGGGSTPTYALYKFDQHYNPVFEKVFKKELKGLSFQSFQALGDDLFIFCTDYEKKDRLFKIYGAKINKNNGELQGGFAELGSFGLETNRANYEMKISPLNQGNGFLMVSNISIQGKVSLGVSLLDKELKKTESTVINLSLDPSFFQLQDICCTRNNKIVLLGKELEEAAIGRKRPGLVFKQFVMAIYNMKGEKEKDVKLDANERYTISGKLIEQDNGTLLLAGFYSNTPQKSDLNGVFINRVDPEKGELLLSSFKEINARMVGKNYIDGEEEIEEEKNKEKNADAEEDEFPNSFIIKTVDINPTDQSIVITSESSKISFFSYHNQRYNSMTRTFTTTSTYTHRFTTQDILMIGADKNGNIRWLNALPKSQIEEIRNTENNFSTGFNYFFSYGTYFSPAHGMPFYSSYKSLILNNKLVLLLNDHSSNNVLAEYGDPVKKVSNFRKKSTVYGVSVDLQTGKMIRKMIASNDDEAVLMPRHGFVINDKVIIPSWRQRMMSKTELKFATISVK